VAALGPHRRHSERFLAVLESARGNPNQAFTSAARRDNCRPRGGRDGPRGRCRASELTSPRTHGPDLRKTGADFQQTNETFHARR